MIALSMANQYLRRIKLCNDHRAKLYLREGVHTFFGMFHFIDSMHFDNSVEKKTHDVYKAS